MYKLTQEFMIMDKTLQQWQWYDQWYDATMPMVQPTLTSNILKLENEFVHEYRVGAVVFYVVITNEADESS